MTAGFPDFLSRAEVGAIREAAAVLSFADALDESNGFHRLMDRFDSDKAIRWATRAVKTDPYNVIRPALSALLRDAADSEARRHAPTAQTRASFEMNRLLRRAYADLKGGTSSAAPAREHLGAYFAVTLEGTVTADLRRGASPGQPAYNLRPDASLKLLEGARRVVRRGFQCCVDCGSPIREGRRDRCERCELSNPREPTTADRRRLTLMRSLQESEEKFWREINPFLARVYLRTDGAVLPAGFEVFPERTRRLRRAHGGRSAA